MRIQHNIMAMSAYRNYNNNTSALSKNLEKLSSGYKINRAGDDAAGLAISEKMRAQITGLNAAQKNVKDGISLVKTAEGAMQEIQDMLNRMDYLATQSANGTYDNETDRAALQKEVDQLNSEINRIAESANFNGIKLLDGTWDVDGKEKALADAQAAVDAASEPAKADAVYDDMSTAAIKGLMLPQKGDSTGNADDVGTNTVLETEKIEFQTPSFQVSLNGISYTMISNGTNQTGTTGGIDGTAKGLTLTVSGQNIAIKESDMKAYVEAQGGTAKAGVTLSGEDIAKIIVNKLQTTPAGATTTASLVTGAALGAGQFGDTNYAWDVRADGENLVFEFADINLAPDNDLNKHFDVKIAADEASKEIKATGATTTYTVTDGIAGTAASTGNTAVTLTATINGKTVNFGTKADVTADAKVADIKSAVDDLASAEGTDADGNTYKFSDYFTVSSTGQTIVFTDKTTGAKGSGNTVTLGLDVSGVTLDTNGTPSKASMGPAATAKGEDAYNTSLTGYVNKGTEVVIPGLPAESEQLASTTLDFTNTDIVDGMKIRLGDEEYTFAVGKDSKFAGGENVIDMTSAKAEDLKAGQAAGTAGAAAREAAFSKLSELARNNETFTVSHQKDSDNIGLKQKAEVKETTDMTSMDKFASYIGVSTVDEDATAEAQKVADAEQADKLAAAKEQLAAAGESTAKELNLQIGDTSDSFNQLGVKIGSMKTAAMGVDGLDISNADSAAKAIQTIKDAINYVSSVRGDLGAYQNRLEHTGNNLSVMAENIQDAESTIRDTDVANEMMSYVKNNILVQSAQAMLAQANQVPQGVLQLLG